MPDKWKEKQQKTCVGKDLIPSRSPSHSASHRQKKYIIKWNQHLVVIQYIICPCNSLEGDVNRLKKQKSLMRGLFMFLYNNQY